MGEKEFRQSLTKSPILLACAISDNKVAGIIQKASSSVPNLVPLDCVPSLQESVRLDGLQADRFQFLHYFLSPVKLCLMKVNFSKSSAFEISIP